MINNISDYIDVCVAIINSHSGRDKTMRAIASLASMLKPARVENSLSYRTLDAVSTHMNAARQASRLLEDLVALAGLKNYGLGVKDTDFDIRFTSVVVNVCTLIGHPLDHVVWAMNVGLVSKTNLWSRVAAFVQIICIFANILRSQRRRMLLLKRYREITNTLKLQIPDNYKSQNDTRGTDYLELGREIHNVRVDIDQERTNVIRFVADLALAGNALLDAPFKGNVVTFLGLFSALTALRTLFVDESRRRHLTNGGAAK